MTTLYKTAESVTPAHPDKVCDQISDAILDACLAQDPYARVAIESVGGHGLITITGELTTTAHINARQVALDAYREAGYHSDIAITTNIVEQSPEIGHGVNQDGAGDQGIMLGYATAETATHIPLELALARDLTRAMGLRDGKAQVTTDNGKVVKILTSVCEHETIDDSALEAAVSLIAQTHLHDSVSAVEDIWLRNPNGRWTIGGFTADTGLTGRKLAVDNYGPNIPLGGGCFSGKDATKVDRSAAYMARKIATEYLVTKGAREVYVHLAYAIGVAEPLMAVATIDGVQEAVTGYELRPQAIIEALDLRTPQFVETARHGHFGNGFRWS
jgi:S-adenosylmethionine synthetase